MLIEGNDKMRYIGNKESILDEIYKLIESRNCLRLAE